ncbi:MAG: hypothetical protein IPJ84_01875 [Bdellovibrionales bacterium]|nr:hypothetical protein [Bdellovibrionales bacterium]
MKTVISCSKTTIVEAWFVVRGLPARYDEDEAGAIITEGKKRIRDLQRMPSMVIWPKTDQPQNSFWSSHLTWAKGRFQARTGHKYLSVHAMASPKSPYEGYTAYVKPAIETWLDIYSESVQKPADFAIATTAFGYINSFEFEARAFDISKYFRLNVGLDIENNESPLVTLENKFSYFDVKTKMMVRVGLNIRPEPSNKTVNVKTHVVSEFISGSGIDINSKLKILQQAAELKENSKRVFFGLTTDFTRDKIMGAKYGGA